jgi:hypothetical protein
MLSLWCKRGRALLWVGAGLLGGRSTAVHKHVPMNSRLTSPISGVYAMFPIHGVKTKTMLLAIHRHLFRFVLSKCMFEEKHQVG